MFEWERQFGVCLNRERNRSDDPLFTEVLGDQRHERIIILLQQVDLYSVQGTGNLNKNSTFSFKRRSFSDPIRKKSDKIIGKLH